MTDTKGIGRQGNAAIEAAMLAPTLVMLAIGIVDYGLSIQRKMQVQHAAQAGAEYVMKNGFNSAAITSAVTGAAGVAGITATPAPTQTCGCALGSTVSVAACGSPCANGTTAGTYVSVSAQGAYSTLLAYPGIPASFTFRPTTMTRTQ